LSSNKVKTDLQEQIELRGHLFTELGTELEIFIGGGMGADQFKTLKKINVTTHVLKNMSGS
jgi:hypothetical protein